MSQALQALRTTIAHASAALQGEYGRWRGLDEAMRWTTLTPGQVRDAQLERLRAVLAHAGERVPYYRDLFQEHRFEPRAVQRTEDLSALPPLTKDIVRAQGDRMLDPAVPRRALVERRTGGSTGEPLRFYVTRDEYEASMAMNLRGFRLAGQRDGDASAKIWGYRKPQRIAHLIAPVTGRLFFDSFASQPADMDAWLATMQRVRPRVVYGYASMLHLFATHAAGRGERVPGLELVFSTAEKLYPAQRAQIEEALGVRVFDFYGCHEVPRLASECAHGRLHEAPDAAVIEIVPSGGDGETGAVLITSLTSFAMPLIRYDLGDAARRTHAPCPCGLPFATLAMEVGKEHHVFAFPGGERLHTSFFFQPLYEVAGMARFQIRHVSAAAVEILWVARPGLVDDAEHDVAQRVAWLNGRVPSGVAVTATRVDEIPPTPRGKRPLVVSQVAEDTRWS